MEHVSTLGLAYSSECSTRNSNTHGWLNYLMHSINKTFPNPGHILINSGCVREIKSDIASYLGGGDSVHTVTQFIEWQFVVHGTV